MPDGFDPNVAAGEVAKELANSKPVNNLLGPLTENIGATLGVITDIARFYTEENLKRIFAKWARQRNDKPLDEAAFKRVLPLLRDAAMQSDDELQERWASLLQNTANAEPGVLPSFGQTLSQLTTDEARYLDRIWSRVSAPKDSNTGKREGRDELTFDTLLRLYNEWLRSSPSPAEMQVYKDRMSQEQIAAYEQMTNFELMLHDLERLSLLTKEVEYGMTDTRYAYVGDSFLPIPYSEVDSKTSYSLTQYGVSFIKAVRSKSASEAKA